MIDGVREDHKMLRHYDAKYAPDRQPNAGLASDLVKRVGFQIMVAYRGMRFLSEAGIPLAPQVASRMIRHVYGSDIHWEARFEPGVVLVHGMGLAVSGAARVERGAILFQNVTLGISADESRRSGAPVVERDAHIGAGSTIVGPVTIGARSKVTANCLVRATVPPDSLVEAPSPNVTPRIGRSKRARSEADG
jgi:serine acetyltransferase